ncbi:MAG: alginate lyase family protein [Acidimicrobiales bacterium]|jgi:uncharacterized heparinase superfamily protein|nr:alginate lyase family protein [Acidimicrobiales bacterium]HMS87953.1 alginate lyase family protein [Acidimicrobiales bacterium]
MGGHDLGRLARTLAVLEPAQVWHRARLRAQRAAAGRWPERAARRWHVDVPQQVGLPEGFEAVDGDLLAHRWSIDDLARGSFDLLNERRDLAGPDGDIAWDPPDASHLWLFHQHYWEWAWSLAAHPDRERARTVFAHQWRSWQEHTRFGRWNAWAPYPASLRSWVFVNVHRALVADSDIDRAFVADLGRHAGFVEHNLELDVGGNHVMKNLKALVGLAAFLHDDRLLGIARRHLEREVATQVLGDGGHYELSPSYHCQVLGDLLDVAELLAAAGRPPLAEVDEAVEAMRRWIGLMRLPDGGVPLFNDCEPVEDHLLQRLGAGPSPTGALTVLPDSGYVVARCGPFHLVADVGQPGPPSPPGHIHADCLSFELAVNGRRFVVDAGTSEYGSGPRRRHERSTAAHNTVEIDGTDQTEVWGAFRAGRRARATLERAEVVGDAVRITASHDGYRHLDGAPRHRRTWVVDPREVRIVDEVTGSGPHRLTARLTVADDGARADPSARQPPTREAVAIEGPMVLASPVVDPTVGWGALATTDAERRWVAAAHADGFGRLVPASVLEADAAGPLPISLTCRITAPS